MSEKVESTTLTRINVPPAHTHTHTQTHTHTYIYIYIFVIYSRTHICRNTIQHARAQTQTATER